MTLCFCGVPPPNMMLNVKCGMKSQFPHIETNKSQPKGQIAITTCNDSEFHFYLVIYFYW